MQFKEGYLWKAGYDEDRDLYTAFIGATSFSLYEINKEIFDGLEDGMGQEAQIPIGEGRKLFMAVNDQYGPPYTIVFDEDYAKLVPWANVEPVGETWPTEMTDAVVEVLACEENNREQRRRKRAAKEEKGN